MTAATIFADYQTAVAAAGGAIHDNAATLALIEDLVSTDLYDVTGLAVIGAGGAKNLGVANAKLYSVAAGFAANDYNQNAEYVYSDTTTHAYRTFRFANGGSTIGWTGFEFRKGNATSVLMQSPTGGGNGTGQTVKVNQGGVLWYMVNGQNYAIVTSSPLFPYLAGTARTGPEFTPSVPYHAVWHWNWLESQLWLGPDGIDTAANSRLYGDLPAMAVNEAVEFHLYPESMGNTLLAEVVVITGDHTIEQMKALAALRAARY